MFGIGLTEMIALAVLGLVLIGPEQIPQVARTIGRFINDIKRSADEVKSQLNEVVQEIPKKMRQDEYTTPPTEAPSTHTENPDQVAINTVNQTVKQNKNSEGTDF